MRGRFKGTVLIWLVSLKNMESDGEGIGMKGWEGKG